MTEIKSFNVKIPKELWAFLKKRSVDVNTSMNSILTILLMKEKEKIEKKLTSNDAKV